MILNLDLGCGQNKRAGFLGVDKLPGPGVDLVVDLEAYPWPWPDESVDEINCNHFVEHLADLVPFFNECWRVLCWDGILHVRAPYYTSMRCWQDPTHKQAISEATFLYFSRGWRRYWGVDHYPIKCDFEVQVAHYWTPEWDRKPEKTKAWGMWHLWNVITDIEATLLKRRHEYEPTGEVPDQGVAAHGQPAAFGVRPDAPGDAGAGCGLCAGVDPVCMDFPAGTDCARDTGGAAGARHDAEGAAGS